MNPATSETDAVASLGPELLRLGSPMPFQSLRSLGSRKAALGLSFASQGQPDATALREMKDGFEKAQAEAHAESRAPSTLGFAHRFKSPTQVARITSTHADCYKAGIFDQVSGLRRVLQAS